MNFKEGRASLKCCGQNPAGMLRQRRIGRPTTWPPLPVLGLWCRVLIQHVSSETSDLEEALPHANPPDTCHFVYFNNGCTWCRVVAIKRDKQTLNEGWKYPRRPEATCVYTDQAGL